MTAADHLPLRGGRARGGHLDDRVPDYVDGALAPAVQHWADQHLLVCQLCRGQVEQERALRERLRGFAPDPGRHEELVQGLLGLARELPPEPTAPRDRPSLVDTAAPPQYQSARNPLMVAAIAVAGCVGAAVVVVTVPQAGGSGAPPSVTSGKVAPAGPNMAATALRQSEADAAAAVVVDQRRGIGAPLP